MANYGLADFFFKLIIADYTLELGENLVSSQTGAGQINVSSLGPRLWRGSITIVQNAHNTISQQLALVRNVQNAGNYFIFTPKKFAAPQSGVSLSGYSPLTVSPVAGYTLTMSGFPPNYPLTTGDYFSYVHATTHRMHQIAADAVADASGVVTVTLVNPIRTNAIPANGLACTFLPARFTARYVPGSLQTGRVLPGHGEAFTFDYVQSMVNI